MSLYFWRQIKHWLTNTLNIDINFDNTTKLFGVLNSKWSALNLILILCRFHIYRMKMNERKPSFVLIKKEINHYFVMEKMIFVKINNLDKFNTKWEPFVLLCTN